MRPSIRSDRDPRDHDDPQGRRPGTPRMTRAPSGRVRSGWRVWVVNDSWLVSPTRLQDGGGHLIAAADGSRLDPLPGWPPRGWLRARCVLPGMFGLRSSNTDDPAPYPGCVCGWPLFDTLDALHSSGDVERAHEVIEDMVTKGWLASTTRWPVVISRVEVGGRILEPDEQGVRRAEIMRATTPIHCTGHGNAQEAAAARYGPRRRSR